LACILVIIGFLTSVVELIIGFLTKRLFLWNLCNRKIVKEKRR